MNFKSYTRKSSAIKGIERAGLDPSVLTQHEGNWGYFLPEAVEEIQVFKTELPPENESLGNELFQILEDNVRPTGPRKLATPKLRRKMLRMTYNVLALNHKIAKRQNKPNNVVSMVRADIRALRTSASAALQFI